MFTAADIDTTESRIRADTLYVMQLYEDARAMRARGSAQVYLYSFDYERIAGQGFRHAEDLSYVMGYIFFDWKVTHWRTCSLPNHTPVFDSLNTHSPTLEGMSPRANANDTQMEREYTSYFVQFIKTGRLDSFGWAPLSVDSDNCFSISLNASHALPSFHGDTVLGGCSGHIFGVYYNSPILTPV